MLYRDYGKKSGEKISVLGFGCMRLPEKEIDGKWYIDEDKALPMLRRAYENGVNYFDSAPTYCNSNSEYAVGKALHDIRDKVFMTSKVSVTNFTDTGDYRRALENSLKKMDTEYLDFYHFWGITKEVFDEKIVKLGLLDEALKCKEEGLIRHISFSFHDKPDNAKYIIDQAPMMETMLIQYNIIDRSNEDAIAYAASKGLGVAAMGPVGGGRLALPTSLTEKLGFKEDSYALALKFVMGNPNITCALSGMQDEDMLMKNIALASEDVIITPEQWEQIAQSVTQLQKFNELYCTGCRYCMPCPAGIQIPDLFSAYTHHNVYGLTETAKKRYEGYKKREGNALPDACLDCGQCEAACPQHIAIREKLHMVCDVLEKL